MALAVILEVALLHVLVSDCGRQNRSHEGCTTSGWAGIAAILILTFFALLLLLASGDAAVQAVGSTLDDLPNFINICGANLIAIAGLIAFVHCALLPGVQTNEYCLRKLLCPGELLRSTASGHLICAALIVLGMLPCGDVGIGTRNVELGYEALPLLHLQNATSAPPLLLWHQTQQRLAKPGVSTLNHQMRHCLMCHNHLQ